MDAFGRPGALGRREEAVELFHVAADETVLLPRLATCVDLLAREAVVVPLRLVLGRNNVRDKGQSCGAEGGDPAVVGEQARRR